MRNKIILVISVGFLVVILLVSSLFKKKVVETPEEQIETQITSETTTTSTTSTTTTKTTKKAVKTTRKTTHKKTQVLKVPTASRQDYINYAKQYGNYDETQMSCLITLWNRESGWNPNLVNKISGACGIPQSKPCNKIYEQQGSYDWQSQIKWGINRINYKYGSPCEALKTHNRIGWY